MFSYRNLSLVTFIKNTNKIFFNNTKKDTVLLGRWNLNHGEKAYKKSERSNTDHCGICRSELQELDSLEKKK